MRGGSTRCRGASKGTRGETSRGVKRRVERGKTVEVWATHRINASFQRIL